jgi:hypothetical protein
VTQPVLREVEEGLFPAGHRDMPSAARNGAGACPEPILGNERQGEVRLRRPAKLDRQFLGPGPHERHADRIVAADTLERANGTTRPRDRQWEILLFSIPEFKSKYCNQRGLGGGSGGGCGRLSARTGGR